MCNKNPNAYKSFDDLTPAAVKKQIENCLRLGLTAEQFPKTMAEAAKKHEKNVEHLEATIAQFKDLADSHRFVRRLKERLDQEKLWIKHYAVLAAEHKKGRDRLHKFMTNLDLKTTVEFLVTEQKEKPKATPVEERKTESTMDAKQFVSETPLRGARRRRFFLLRLGRR